MGWLRESKCGVCSRAAAACICRSVQRRHKRENAREAKPKQYVAAAHLAMHDWCSCGCLIRDGKCVSATCGKSA